MSILRGAFRIAGRIIGLSSTGTPLRLSKVVKMSEVKSTPTDELREYVQAAPDVVVLVMAAVPIILHALGYMRPPEVAKAAPAGGTAAGDKAGPDVRQAVRG